MTHIDHARQPGEPESAPRRSEPSAHGGRFKAQETSGVNRVVGGENNGRSGKHRSGKHIVDVLIEERAPHLAASPFWPLLRPPLYLLLGYRKARNMTDAIAPLSGLAAMDYVSKLLRLNISIRGIDNIPKSGACIIVANHPTGIADGLAMYDALRPIRPELCFFANADAHRVCPGFYDVLIPVAWPPEKRTMKATKLTLRMAREALDEQRAVIIFPAGRLARRIEGVIQDPKWEHSAVALARKFGAPVIPAHVSGPFPRLFHFFNRFSPELRDITLFHELLNKVEGDYKLIFGKPIDPCTLSQDSEAATARIKAYVERVLSASPDAVFKP